MTQPDNLRKGTPMRDEIVREATPVEKVAFAILALTYGEMLELGAAVRDIVDDRASDGADMADARTMADILHSWASSEMGPSDG
jgi:hypothetical protein